MVTTAIAIDFDGTIAKHEYPGIGEPVPGAFEWLRKFEEAGAKLILYTMRADNTYLAEAVAFCKEHGIKFWGLNTNPTQLEWTNSPKCWANIFIDDHGVCVPLVDDGHYRKFVDWSTVGSAAMKIIEERKRRDHVNA